MPNVICPFCSHPTALPDAWPHPGFVCPHCHATVALATPAPPPPPPASTPANPFAIDDGTSSDEPDEDYRPKSRSRPSSRRNRHAGGMGQANQLVAGIGAALLLIGQFLPMVTAPFGIWLSFVDLPWKAITIGLGAVAEAEEKKKDPAQKRPAAQAEPPETKPARGSSTIMLVVVIALFYPLLIFVLVGISFLQICAGSSPGVFTLTGGISLAATLFYGVALLALSTDKDLRFVMALLSPGFGWAVVTIGALALTGAGMIRSDPRR